VNRPLGWIMSLVVLALLLYLMFTHGFFMHGD
jgi:hypothetical protein